MFGANINALDGNNKTPLDLVVGSYRFLTRQESGFTLIDIETKALSPVAETKVLSSVTKRPPLKSQISFTDNDVISEFVQSREYSAITAFTSSFSKTGDVSGMAKLLSDHGGQRGKDVAKKVTQTRQTNVRQFQDMTVAEPKESTCTPSKVHQCTGVQDDWTSKIATLNYQISCNIDKKLRDISYSLGQRTDEAMAVGIQMKELKHLRDAGSRILFLDGGGMKGLVQIEILSQLEKETGRKITELFDWIVGTSTGGIIALALVHGKYCICTFIRVQVTSVLYRVVCVLGGGGEWRCRERVFF